MSDRYNGKLRNLLGQEINPGTEDTLQAIAGFNIPVHDYIGAGYPNGTTETYTYKTGGSGGTTVGTITVVYTDATKANISSVTKS
jgi:hypothetical protein